ncbi:hypothetical protein [Sporocytophaga myxococcoides]|nr:hypothetical protein [Sporocytophaga myxococcoides]
MNKALCFFIVLIACIACSNRIEERKSEYDLLIGKWRAEKIVFTGLSSWFETSFSEGESIDKRFLNKQFTIALMPDSTFILDNRQEDNFSGKYRVNRDMIFLKDQDIPYLYFKIDSLINHNLCLQLNYAMFYTVENDSIFIVRGPHAKIVMKKE